MPCSTPWHRSACRRSTCRRRRSGSGGRSSKRGRAERAPGRRIMGTIVGAAIVSHSPSLMMPEAERIAAGAGRDSDLIAGFARLRQRLDAARADTLVIFDTHWITTNMHVVAGAAHFRGIYTSDEMPHVLQGIAFDYPGAPDLAEMIEEVA